LFSGTMLAFIYAYLVRFLAVANGSVEIWLQAHPAAHRRRGAHAWPQPAGRW
jgi:ABC-type Fe3+ transport system permease subunit